MLGRHWLRQPSEWNSVLGVELNVYCEPGHVVDSCSEEDHGGMVLTNISESAGNSGEGQQKRNSNSATCDPDARIRRSSSTFGPCPPQNRLSLHPRKSPTQLATLQFIRPI